MDRGTVQADQNVDTSSLGASLLRTAADLARDRDLSQSVLIQRLTKVETPASVVAADAWESAFAMGCQGCLTLNAGLMSL